MVWQLKIRHAMEEIFLFEFNGEITEESDLFKLGVMDSFGYLQLMHYIEEEFSFQFTEQELLSDVPVSLAGIVKLVSHHMASSETGLS